MKKLIRRVGICLFAAGFLWTASLLRDQRTLEDSLIRLHVVANSDSPQDQQQKLQVRDAILESIQEAMSQVADRDAAQAYLEENLPKLESIANQTLEKLGSPCHAVVSLCQEAFDTRYYDTFTLPAGIYEALRITIGEGEGHNWWCVAFPTLCLPAVSEDVDAVAADAGLSQPIRGAIIGQEPYHLRFYFLDLLGKVQTKFAS